MVVYIGREKVTRDESYCMAEATVGLILLLLLFLRVRSLKFPTRKLTTVDFQYFFMLLYFVSFILFSFLRYEANEVRSL